LRETSQLFSSLKLCRAGTTLEGSPDSAVPKPMRGGFAHARPRLKGRNPWRAKGQERNGHPEPGNTDGM